MIYQGMRVEIHLVITTVHLSQEPVLCWRELGLDCFKTETGLVLLMKLQVQKVSGGQDLAHRQIERTPQGLIPVQIEQVLVMTTNFQLPHRIKSVH